MGQRVVPIRQVLKATQPRFVRAVGFHLPAEGDEHFVMVLRDGSTTLATEMLLVDPTLGRVPSVLLVWEASK